ncbi:MULTISPECIES: hypothetical protein [Neisseria]|uniref:hypothetical protein n=1 Tax=Neisseria TaxID=482 RepID=UPI0006CE62E7|nr:MULTISPECIES: hypothetical protein [Neisseria]KPN70593.1 hypothetical protein AKG09_11245 [Neisseria sp. 83E34]QMT36440.1 hypothetical protein H3L96_04260 [Neisseria wadsworthii]
MMNALDYIDSPMDSISSNDPYLIVDVIELIDDDQVKILLIDHLLNNLLSIDNTPYLLGYTLYLKSTFMDNKNKILLLEQAKRPFKNAIMLDSENTTFAKAYLAHVYYDLEEFTNALHLIEQIPENYFAKLPSRQNWRDLKIQELKICCLINLKKFINFELILYKFLLKISKSNQYNIPLPTELSNTIKKISS